MVGARISVKVSATVGATVGAAVGATVGAAVGRTLFIEPLERVPDSAQQLVNVFERDPRDLADSPVHRHAYEPCVCPGPLAIVLFLDAAPTGSTEQP